MTDEGSTVERIEKLTMEGFRGFGARAELDLNADIVLVTGPNGSGKSSFMEALLYLLTESSYRSEAEKDEGLLARALKHKDVQEWSLNATLLLRNAQGSPSSIEHSRRRYADSKLERGGWSPTRIGAEDVEPTERSRELGVRLTAFFQDEVEKLFDRAAVGSTLAEALGTRPRQWQELTDRVGRLLRGLGDVQRDLQRRIEHAEAADEAFFPQLWEQWRQVRRATKAVDKAWRGQVTPALPTTPEVETLVKAAREHTGATSGLSAYPALLRHLEEHSKVLELELRDDHGAATKADATRLNEILQERQRIRNELGTIEKQYPNLDREVSLFDAAGAGASLLQVFQALEIHAACWHMEATRLAANQADPDGKLLGGVAEELGWVEPSRAAVCRDRLQRWLEPRRTAHGRRERLRDRDSILQKEEERYRASEQRRALERLRNAIRESYLETADWRQLYQYHEARSRRTDLEQELARIRSARDQLDWLRTELEAATQLPENQQALVRAANEVLRYFNSLPPLGLTSVKGSRIEPVLREGDGRGLDHFSTGQKSQVAVALLVAQSLVAHYSPHVHHGHRVLLLDDVSTSYDLSNLTREALVWRSLAYQGAELGRWQLFISSHHDQLTNHLLDLLVPPPGRSLRLLRFGEWSLEHGPKIEPYAIEPSAEATEDRLWEQLRQELGYVQQFEREARA